MVIDTILLFNELELLEVRLEELWPVVDCFYVQEATRTFTNQDKPLHFQQNRKRFDRYASKIRHHVLDDYEGAPCDDPMAFDTWQKGKLLEHLLFEPDSTLAIVADADEIPRRQEVSHAVTHLKDIATLEMTITCHWLNCVRPNAVWTKPKIIRLAAFEVEDFQAPQIRQRRPRARYKQAGWHFTSLHAYLPEKIAAWGHQEWNRRPYNTPEYMERAAREGLDPFGRGHRYEFCEDLGFLPKCVQDQPERFKKLLYFPE